MKARRHPVSTVAMNEALMIGSVRQHELTEVADATNARLQREIRERILAEEALRRAQEQLTAHAALLERAVAKYTDLYDCAPVGYLTIDGAGTLREANLSMAALLGIPRPELLNKPFAPFVAPADGALFDTLLTNAFQQGTREDCDLNLVVKGGVTVEVRMEALVLGNGHDCRIAVTDITERKRAETNQQILNKLGSVGILAGGIAHDFNNLLTVILLNLELAQRRLPSGTEVAMHLDEAMKTTLLARGLTAQLLTFATGGAPMRRPTRLAALIQESVLPALAGPGVQCEFAIADTLWAADVDAVQIGQVIRNLILNASEAMPQGGVITVQADNVTLALHGELPLPPGDYVRLCVSDQGHGIAKELLTKIFDPYFSTKQMGNQKGTGLGLTICHSIIHKHGGAIIASSKGGDGASLIVYLPALTGWVGDGVAPAKSAIPWHGRVLVMDDDESIRKLVGLMLAGMGQTVELAEHGEMALARYEDAQHRGQPFDAVLLDLMVRGGLGGVETVQALRQRNPNVKAIAMSGYVQDPVILDPERYGFAASLAKPFDHATMKSTLARVLGPLVKVPAAARFETQRC